MLPYVLCAPDYHHASAGIRATHRLVHELNEHGQRAYTACAGNPVWNEPTWQGGENCIVIYPEVVYGNPLGAPNVVRWVLNTPGYLGGDVTYDPREIVYTWSHRFTLAPLLTVNVMEHDLFYDNGHFRDTDACYMGKGNYRGVSELADTRALPHITRSPCWPSTRLELASLLKRTGTLYTYDDCTAVVDEALACGCRVVLLPEGREMTVADAMHPTPEQHEARLQAFIAHTQNRFGGT